jgi:DNA-binding winged helix-turn-helix (wHTH) protein
MQEFSKQASERCGSVQFGPFLFDPQTRQVSRAGQTVHLTPKAFELLGVLLEYRPRAVTKTALHGRLWPATFVGDANLAILVAELRAALRDKARQPMYIRTVHAYGYAFSGEAHDATESAMIPACWLIARARRLLLREGNNLVGRDPDLPVWLDSKTVSRRHARVFIEPQGATIEDLGSKNGTWLNGERVMFPKKLTNGDRIRFGAILLTFRTREDEDSTATRSHAG